jgi:serine phosphatase RsbU (regulator of sigma subunit)
MTRPFKQFSLLVVLLFAFTCQLFANKDSLLRELKKSHSDKDLYTLNFELGWEYAFSNPDSAYYYAKRGLLISKRMNDPSVFAQIYNLLGVSCQLGKNYKDAISFYRESLANAQKTNNTKAILTAYGNIGALYTEIDDQAKALEYAFLSLNLAKQTSDSLKIANNSNNISLIYSNKKELDKALGYGLASLKIYTALNDENGLCNNYGNLGNIYLGLNQLDKAKESYENCHQIALKVNLTFEIAKSANELGALHKIRKEFEKSLAYYQTAEKYAKDSEDQEVLKDTYSGLYQLFYEKNDFKNAKLYMGKYFEAFEEYNKSAHAAEVSKNELAYEFKSKSEQDSIKNAEKEKVTKAQLVANKAQIEKDRLLKIGLTVLSILLVLFGYFMYNRFKLIKNQNSIIEQKNKETEIQKNEIENKNKEILDSINYAKRIQQGLLENKRQLNGCFPENFIYFNPKDIVSGDFYWTTLTKNSKDEDVFYLACCDSTGHGVPGAFMSLLNMALFSESINEKNLAEPNVVFNHIRARLIELIGADGQQDGFDGTLIAFNLSTKKITYASANNGGVLVKGNHSIDELQYDKMPVGRGIIEKGFSLFELDYQKGDTLYLFTDGYADQFGGPSGKKFKYKKLLETILTANDLTLTKQAAFFDETFESWRGKLEQIDDVQVIGVRL